MIEYHYGAQQIGKTTKIIDTYLRNPDKTAVFFINEDMIKRAIDICSKSGYGRNHNFFSTTSKYACKGKYYKHIIFDEFDFIKSKDQNQIIEVVTPHVIPTGKISIYTTPCYLRDKTMFALCRLARARRISIQELIITDFIPDASDEYLHELVRMYNDIITRPDVKLIRMERPDWAEIDWTSEIYLNEEQYYTQTMGALFKPENITNININYDRIYSKR